jgi:hypothetical protein
VGFDELETTKVLTPSNNILYCFRTVNMHLAFMSTHLEVIILKFVYFLLCAHMPNLTVTLRLQHNLICDFMKVIAWVSYTRLNDAEQFSLIFDFWCKNNRSKITS